MDGIKNKSKESIRQAAHDVGFDFVGFTPAAPAPHASYLPEWLDKGMHGNMTYLEDAAGRRGDPRRYLPWAQSLVVVALTYHTGDTLSMAPSDGAISRYAWGRDYHRIIRGRLELLREAIATLEPGCQIHPFVDTSPVLEKGLAQAAGLGWQGKHTNLIRKKTGSWFFLGGVATDIALPGDAAGEDHCGTCSRCIEVCPTNAIVAPYMLDARLCIAYLTIENRGPIPIELRAPIGNRIFGCDDCQEVCPWNHFAQKSSIPEFHPANDNLNPQLLDLIGMSRAEWNRRFKKTPVRRAHYEGFIRNVAVALGNWAAPQVVAPLVSRLDDPAALIRGHVAWALGQAATASAHEALQHQLRKESDTWVCQEIELALAATNR